MEGKPIVVPLQYHSPAKLQFGPQTDLYDRLKEIMNSGWYTAGRFGRQLAHAIAESNGYKWSVPFGQATHAIFVIARYYKIQGKKRLWTPLFTWPSTYMPFDWLGYEVRFVDVDPETWLADFLDVKAKKEDLFVPVDTFGSVHPFAASADWTWTDSAQSLGAAWGNTDVPRIVSLSGSKIATAGEAGVLLTNDKKLYDFAARHTWFSRLSEFNAALGLSYFRQLPDILKKKAAIAETYRQRFPKLQWQHIPRSTNHYVVAAVVPNRSEFRDANPEVEFRTYYESAVSEYPKEDAYGLERDDLPVTSELTKHILCFPSFPDLKPEQIASIKEP